LKTLFAKGPAGYLCPIAPPSIYCQKLVIRLVFTQVGDNNGVRFGVVKSKEKRIYLKSSPQPSQMTVEGTFEPL
jgi:hypothetical protein